MANSLPAGAPRHPDVPVENTVMTFPFGDRAGAARAPDLAGAVGQRVDPGDRDRVRGVLGGGGFEDVHLGALAAPMFFGPSAADAEHLILGVAGWMPQGLDDAGRARALDALRASIAAHHGDRGVVYGSAAWIVTARRP